MMPQRAQEASPPRLGAPPTELETRVLRYGTRDGVPSFTAVVRMDLERGSVAEARRVLERLTLVERRSDAGAGEPLPDWMGVDVFVKDAPSGKWRVFLRPEAPSSWTRRLGLGARG